MDKPQFKTSFANIIIKPIVSEARDKYLALASLEEVAKFLPDVNIKDNKDLLPIAFNACVVNRVNKNTDLIDTATAIGMYKQFINKPINVEHHRQKVIGMILTAGFSTFGSDKPLTEEEAAKLTSPFNITLGGLIWRNVAPDLSELIEDASDPTSLKYQDVSASWELGFSGYRIALMEGGKKNLAQATKIIDDPAEVEKAQNKLIALGGDGKFEDLFAYRLLTYDVLPLGVGLTEQPAAEVKGIASTQTLAESTPAEPVTNQQTHAENLKSVETAIIQPEPKPNAEIAEANVENNQNKISQPQESNVKTERNKKEEMKINSIQDISEASVKDVAAPALASAVSDFIQTSLKAKSDEWEKQKGEFKTQVSTAETQAAEAKAAAEKAQATADALAKEVEAFKKEKAALEAVAKFNARMNEVTEAFTLDDEARAAVVEEVKAIDSDEGFTKWKTKANILLKGFAKQKTSTATATVAVVDTKTQTDSKTAIAAVIDNVDTKNKGGLPNGTSATPSLMDLAKLAFNKDNLIVSK